jgi:hypothetical protein
MQALTSLNEDLFVEAAKTFESDLFEEDDIDNLPVRGLAEDEDDNDDLPLFGSEKYLGQKKDPRGFSPQEDAASKVASRRVSSAVLNL